MKKGRHYIILWWVRMDRGIENEMGIGIQASVVGDERRKNSTLLWVEKKARQTDGQRQSKKGGCRPRGLFKRSVGLIYNSSYDDSVEGVSLLKSMERSTGGGGQGSE